VIALRSVPLVLVLSIVLSSCGSPVAEQKSLPRSTPKLLRAHGMVNRASIKAIESGLRTIQAGYGYSDWNRVGSVFSLRSLRAQYVRTLRFWKEDAGGQLRVDLISSEPLGKGRYAVNVRFSGDRRAVPSYALFEFASNAGGARIVDTITGLHGSNYHNVNWAISRTKHFTVYHSPYQLTGADKMGLADLEHQRAVFARKFGVKLPALAAYYLYPEQRLIARWTSHFCGSNPDNVGCTVQQAVPPAIHASEWVSFHEPIHVYQSVMEPPRYTDPLFIAEGMAVALEDKQVDPRLSDYCSEIAYVPLDTCAKFAIANVKLLSLLPDTGFKAADPGYAYSLAGSFVKFLILRFGYRTFGRFYYVLAAQPKDRVLDYNVATHRVLGASIQQLLHDWSDQLCGSGCR
jgi:hypothetical protein